MIFHRLGLLHKNQRGITMIELVIVIGITGLIVSGITMTIFQVISGNARSSNHMIAIRQVQNAGYWLSHDAQMAQIVDTDGPELVTLTWEEYSVDGDGDVHEVVYTLEDNKLQRIHSINGAASETAIVAEFIDTISCQFTGGDKLTLMVTVTVGTGSSQEASETRTYEVITRPSV